MIKLHLLNPDTGALILLKGIRPFILIIDGCTVIGKVCKVYPQTAIPSNLSMQVSGKSLIVLHYTNYTWILFTQASSGDKSSKSRWPQRLKEMPLPLSPPPLPFKPPRFNLNTSPPIMRFSRPRRRSSDHA